SAPEIRRVTDPVVVHVDAQRGRRRVLREQTRFARHLRERHARPTELLRNGHLEIASGFQLVEILQAECVVAIVAGRPLAAPLQKTWGKYGPGSPDLKSFLRNMNAPPKIAKNNNK